MVKYSMDRNGCGHCVWGRAIGLALFPASRRESIRPVIVWFGFLLVVCERLLGLLSGWRCYFGKLPRSRQLQLLEPDSSETVFDALFGGRCIRSADDVHDGHTGC